MLDSQAIWVFLHVVLFVYWLGADITVFYSSLQIIKQENSIETRLAIFKILNFVNWFPAISSILMLPVGIMLAVGQNLILIPTILIIFMWIGIGIWLFFSVCSNTQRGTKIGTIYSNIDLVLRIMIIVFLLLVASVSLWHSDLIQSSWLILKIYLFSYVLVCGLGIRFTFASFGIAFSRLIKEGTSPEIEQAIKRPVIMVKPWVLALWGGLFLMALIGISQPQI